MRRMLVPARRPVNRIKKKECDLDILEGQQGAGWRCGILRSKTANRGALNVMLATRLV